MPRSLGMLLIAATSCLCGVFTWFCLIWLIAAAATLTRAPVLDIVMLILSPHMAGWLIAMGLAAVTFVLGVRLARAHRLSWLGFAPETALGTGTERNASDSNERAD